MSSEKIVFITGATGTMGSATVSEILSRDNAPSLRLLVRPGKKNRKLLDSWKHNPKITLVEGDLRNKDDVRKAMGNAALVLHIGGMVSPEADHCPELTMEVNTMAMRNITEVSKERQGVDEPAVLYIGSVAQTGFRHEPTHWGRTGDPVFPAVYDTYALSKIRAEKILAESGLKKWASLRQSGILHKELILKGSDPITFHVPLRGVLEWTTVEDSGRLMANLACGTIPDSFWKEFYNIGSGPGFRLSNYKFEVLLLKALGCPPPRKVFETNWFATSNFHGQWYLDSDRLESMFHFRENITAEEYFKRMASQSPFWIKLAPLAPAFLIKKMMKMLAKTRELGPLDWIARNDMEEKVNVYFGSREKRDQIPGWNDFDLSDPSQEAIHIDHGYDESKALNCLDIRDMEKAAEFRGGKCLGFSGNNGKPDGVSPDLPYLWECAGGHRFEATPRLILKGGHWCPHCESNPIEYRKQADRNPFLKQIL